jgi:hypothetical protein
MEAIATLTEADARFKTGAQSIRVGTLPAEIVEYCAVARSMREIVEWLGEAARRVTHALVRAGRLVNLCHGRSRGIFLDASKRVLASERIDWHAPDAGQLDDDTTVLLSVEGQGEPHDAFRCAGTWYWAASGLPVVGHVIAWAHKPQGPQS